MIDLDELERLHEAATPGPWASEGACIVAGPVGARMLILYDEGGPSRDDSALIAAARNALPELLRLARKAKRLEDENGELRLFALDMFECADWPDGGDIDGFAFQDAAEARGLLKRTQALEPCGDGCWCAEYGDFPQDCMRKTARLTGDALAEGE